MKSSARSVELLLVEAGALWVQESPLALQAKRGGVFVVYEADEADLLRELAICIHRDLNLHTVSCWSSLCRGEHEAIGPCSLRPQHHQWLHGACVKSRAASLFADGMGRSAAAWRIQLCRSLLECPTASSHSRECVDTRLCCCVLKEKQEAQTWAARAYEKDEKKKEEEHAAAGDRFVTRLTPCRIKTPRLHPTWQGLPRTQRVHCTCDARA